MAHSIADIRISGPCTDDMMDEISGTFATNDWDSDIEDSNSSEEFLYAKGTSQIGEYLRSTQNTSYSSEPREQINLEFDVNTDGATIQHEIGDEPLDTQEIWNSHDDLITVSDLIAVTTNGERCFLLDLRIEKERKNKQIKHSLLSSRFS